MSRYLLQISIGPVQDFIASARRARDLWFGSSMLSKISKAVARAIRESGGKLIFPYSDNLDSDLKHESSFNVANVILAEYDNEEIVKTASATMKSAAENQWLSFVDETYNNLKIENIDVNEGLWDYQKNEGVIEFYSAWHPFDDSNEISYKEARQQVKRLIDARKSIRDFVQWEGRHGVPKSSLDGLRESVLKDNDNEKPEIKSSFKKKEGESLDLIGCVKRSSGGKKPFPSVVRVAVDPWLRKLAEDRDGKKLIEEIKEQCRTLDGEKIISSVENTAYEKFPYEGSILLPSRYREIFEEAKNTGKFNPHELEEIKTNLKSIEDKVLKMKKICSFEYPYLAILAADGDKMGKAISDLKTSDKHREFSKKLSSFAQSAHRIVDENHYGVCIYSGGDDVLALLPFDQAVQCARALYESFSRCMEGFEDVKEKPTLSVGITIVHALEDLGLMRKFVQEAKEFAKKGEKEDKSDERNALAITVRARKSAEISFREQWDSAQVSKAIDKRLQFWIECYARKEIPVRFAYELRSVADLYKEWRNKESVSRAMQEDVFRIFKRKDIKFSDDEEKFVKEYIKSQIKDSYKSIIDLSDELIIAQWLGGYQA